MGNYSTSYSFPTPSEPELIVQQNNIRSQNIGGLFNDDLFSDLTLVVGQKRFKVHKAILAAQSEYFRTLLTNGMIESSKNEITIEESNVEIFEKLLRYVYSGEMEFNMTNDSVEMLVMANKYLFAELQQPIVTHLNTILSMENFWSIYSVAFACSSTSLWETCLQMADSNPSTILKMDGISILHARALNEIIRRLSSKLTQTELFDAISNWMTANEDKDADVLLSNIRLDEMGMSYLLETVRPSNIFPDRLILDAVAVISKKSPVEAEIDAVKPPHLLHLVFEIQYAPARQYAQSLQLTDLCPFDRIERIKYILWLRLRGHFRPRTAISLSYQGVILQDHQTLVSCGITNGSRLVMR